MIPTTPIHADQKCSDCGKTIEPGNFSGLCWGCLAKLPATCGYCGEIIPGYTAADECGGSYICDNCTAAREELDAAQAEYRWEQDLRD